MLIPDKRKFKIPRPTNTSPDTAIVAVGLESLANGLFFRSHRNEEFFAVLERECSSRNIRLIKTVARFSEKGTSIHYSGGPVFDPQKSGAIGYLVMAESMEDIGALLNRLGRTRRPVAILDETGTFEEQTIPQRLPLVSVFSTANSRRCGYLAGWHLLRLGHRKVCFISAYHGNTWSVNRYLGVREAFENAGFFDAVIPCVYADYVNAWSIPTQPIEQALKDHIPFKELRTVEQQFYTIHDHMPDPARKSYSFIASRLIEARHHEIERHYTLPLLEQAFGHTDATAWIAATDQMALYALDYLEGRRIPVPRAKSIMGFDDILEAFDTDLTTFNFNLPAIAHRILSFILDPLPGRQKKTIRKIEIDGMVIDRATTRKMSP